MKLLHHGPDALTYFINILIKTKQNGNLGFAFEHYLDPIQTRKKLNKFRDVTRILFLLEDMHFIDCRSFSFWK